MGTRPAWWVPRESSYFRETFGESVLVGPRICVFGMCGSASLPATGAKHRGDPMGAVEGPCGYHAG